MKLKTDSLKNDDEKKKMFKIRRKMIEVPSLRRSKNYTERSNKIKTSSRKNYYFRKKFEEKKRNHKTLMENIKLPTLKINLNSISLLNEKIDSEKITKDLILYKILKSKKIHQKEKITKKEEQKKQISKYFKLANKVKIYKKLLSSIKISQNLINLENLINSREKSSLITKKEKNDIKIFIFGGQGSDIYSDLYKIDMKNKQKEKINIENTMNKSIERYGHTSHLYKKNSILIIGGFGYRKTNHYNYVYDTKNFFYKINLKKKEIELINIKSVKSPLPRIHHSSIMIENKFLVIFGGEDREGNLLNDFWVFSFDFKIWLELKIDFGSVFFKEGICKHSMVIVEDDFILKNFLKEWKNTSFEDDRDFNDVIKNEKRMSIVNIYKEMKNKVYKPKFLNEKIFLNIQNKILIQKKIIQRNNKEKKKLNFSNRKKNLKENKNEIEKKNDINKKYEVFSTIKENEIFTKFLNKFKKKMILIYGGINSKIENDKKIRIFQFDEKRKKLYLKKIKMKGKIPNSRFSHTMNYFSKLKLLIIFGGKNIFNQNINYISIFSLFSKNWNKIKIFSNLKISRINHCSAIEDNHFFIFGGTGFGGYVFENLYHNIIRFDDFL